MGFPLLVPVPVPSSTRYMECPLRKKPFPDVFRSNLNTSNYPKQQTCPVFPLALLFFSALKPLFINCLSSVCKLCLKCAGLRVCWFTCVFVCAGSRVCWFMCVLVYVCVRLRVCWFVCVLVHVCVRVCWFTCVLVHMCAGSRVCSCVLVYVCVGLWVCWFTCVFVCAGLRVCWFMCVLVYVCASLRVCWFTCVLVYVCARVFSRELKMVFLDKFIFFINIFSEKRDIPAPRTIHGKYF